MRWKGRASSSSSQSGFCTLTDEARPRRETCVAYWVMGGSPRSAHRDRDVFREPGMRRLHPLVPGIEVGQRRAVDRQREPAMEVGAERDIGEREGVGDVAAALELAIEDAPERLG